nr:unnamed protein product [Spirometra erinaceieuropaei]
MLETCVGDEQSLSISEVQQPLTIFTPGTKPKAAKKLPTTDAVSFVDLAAAFDSFNRCTRIRTTAYHPAANGMAERFHRQLKASLRAAVDPENWTDHLPLVLFGIRSATKPDLDCYAAELVFGATVRLPGEVISPTPRGAVADPTNLLHRLRQFMRTLSLVLPRSSASPSYPEKDLATCSHVYLRCDRVRRPLEPPYNGPFRDEDFPQSTRQ